MFKLILLLTLNFILIYYVKKLKTKKFKMNFREINYF